MTSVPKPLKFLRPHYSTLTEHYAKMPANDLKRFFADVLSILSTTMQKEGSRQALKYRLEGTKEGLTSWGHEYIRNIAGEIGEEFKERTDKGTDVADLLALVEEIVPFNMQHNAEVDAVDLLCEVDQVQTIEKLCEEPSFIRVCLYLQGLANFAATQADKVMYLNVCMNLYLKYKEYVGALRIALKLNDAKAVAAVFGACEVAATPSSALATRMPTTTALTTVSQTSERQSAHNLNLAGLASTPLSLTSMPSQGKQSVVDEDSESATWILLALGATLVAMCICMALQPFVTQRRVAKRAPSAVDYEQIPSLQAHRPDEDSDEAVGRTQV